MLARIFRLIGFLLALLIGLFIGMFAFEEPVFSVGFFMMLIPTTLIVGCAIIGKFFPKIGSIIFGVLAVATCLFYDTYKHPLTFLTITFPLLAVGVLFYLERR
jgi:hypothetical protein